jgi:dTDP-4-amino-4,6-dideoxygalactose transaminase
LFYLLTNSEDDRTRLIEYLGVAGIMAIFHYVPLHSSPFYGARYTGNALPNTDRYAATLLRLPLYFDLSLDEVHYIVQKIKDYYAGV